MAGVDAVPLDSIRHEPVVPCGVVEAKEVQTIRLGVGHRYCMGQRMYVHGLIITHQVHLSTDLAGVGGIEPTGLGVKGPCLNHLAKPLLEKLAGADGFEPPFHESESSALTAVLRPYMWWKVWDSNPCQKVISPLGHA